MKGESRKVLYISNVNLNGPFLLGVVEKIKGQLAAFSRAGFSIDNISPEDKGSIVLKKSNGSLEIYKGSRSVFSGKGFFSKLIQHFKVIWFGSLNFTSCESKIITEKYDAVYLRFFLPGKDLITLLKRIKKDSPNTVLFLEYPTLSVEALFKTDLIRRISFLLNRSRIKIMNSLSDYIITLTKDEYLFGKPALFMANGIELSRISPINPPCDAERVIILGVASDCAFYHGFDRVIKGLAKYKNTGGSTQVLFRIISNPLSRNMGELKALVNDLKVEDMVSFELPKIREELAKEYNHVHIGMGTLALHRIGLRDNYSLKHREYAAFGLPFVMSEGDDHFEDSPFVFKVERDESPLEIQAVVDFYKSVCSKYPNYSKAFRSSIENIITWEAQMKNVFEAIKKGKEG